MLPSEDIRAFWNTWNVKYLEHGHLDTASLHRAAEVLKMLKSLNLENPSIVEVGCGTGWLATQLTQFGSVTAIDIADEVIGRARQTYPDVHFLAGDITTMGIAGKTCDVLITLETIGNVSDQRAFVDAISRLVKPGGYLILTAQNKFVFTRREDVHAPEPGQIRNWVSLTACRSLLKENFRLIRLTTVLPAGHRGILRFTNSYKIDSLAQRIGALTTVNRLRERVGLGQSIVLLARRK